MIENVVPKLQAEAKARKKSSREGFFYFLTTRSLHVEDRPFLRGCVLSTGVQRSFIFWSDGESAWQVFPSVLT